MESFYGTEIRRNTHTQKKKTATPFTNWTSRRRWPSGHETTKEQWTSEKKNARGQDGGGKYVADLYVDLSTITLQKKKQTKESARRCIPKRRRKKKRIRIPFIAGATAQRHNTERCRLANFDVTLRANQSTWIDSKPTKTKKNKCISLLWDTPLRKKPT